MVYAEEYLFWNAVIPLLSLPLGGRLAGLPAPDKPRLAAAGCLGAAAALGALYAPRTAPLLLCALPLGVWLCFQKQSLFARLRCTVTTLSAAFLAGGAMAALRQTGLSVRLSAGATLTLMALLCLLVRLRPQALADVTQVELRMGGHGVILPAMLDSGNLLSDPVTGLPVVVAPACGVARLFPQAQNLHDLTALPLGFRLLSVRTAAGTALMPLFQPDSCRLYVNGRAREARVQVAVAGPEYGGVQALVPLMALGHAQEHCPSERAQGGSL